MPDGVVIDTVGPTERDVSRVIASAKAGVGRRKATARMAYFIN
jgi:hypothetical protein